MGLPLPRVVSDVGPGGGINTAMGGMNALAKQQLETAYYPPMAQADIAAKNVYAQYLPAQTMATLMSNPQFWTQDKNVVNALLDKYSKSISNPPSIQSLSGGNQLSGGLLSQLWNKMGYGGNANPMQQDSGYAPPMQGGQPGGNAPAPSGNAPSGAGTGADVASDAYVQNVADHGNNQPPVAPVSAAPVIPAASGSAGTGLPANTTDRIAGATNPNAYGGVNPASIVTAQAAGLSARATGEAGAQVEQQKAMENDDIDNSREAINQNNFIAKAKELHSKIPNSQRGKIGGTLIPDIMRGSAATEFDTTMKNIVASIKNQQSGSNATNKGLELATDSKADRTMQDEAFKHLMDYSEGMNSRIIEKPAFNQALTEKGYTPAQIQTMWQYYQVQKPFYDAKHETKDETNLGTWDKFYADPARVKAAFSPSAAKEIDKNFSNVSSDVTPGQVALPGGLVVPKTFESQKAYEEWFYKQPAQTRRAYNKYLESKKPAKKG